MPHWKKYGCVKLVPAGTVPVKTYSTVQYPVPGTNWGSMFPCTGKYDGGMFVPVCKPRHPTVLTN